MSIPRKVIGLFLFSGAFILSSCGSVPSVSRRAAESVIENKLAAFNLNTTKAQVFYEVGDPAFLMTFPTDDGGQVEVYGFEYSRSLSRDTPMVVFKNNRYVGSMNRSYDLLRVLQTLHIVRDAKFHEFFNEN